MAELIGYIGSVLVAVSLMMSNIWKLRWINLFGALFFVAYGIALKAYPVVVVNGFIVLIDAYFLNQMARKKDYFSLLTLKDPQGPFIRRFLNFYAADIQGFFPDFDIETIKEPLTFFMLRNIMPIGIFVYETEPEGVARIHLDYVVPEYRDLGSARFLYHHRVQRFRDQGLKTFAVRTGSEATASYFRSLGFKESAGDSGVLVKEI